LGDRYSRFLRAILSSSSRAQFVLAQRRKNCNL